MPPRISPKARPRQTFPVTFIKAWRDDRELSQDQLVERVRERVSTFSKSTLSRLENGKQAYTQPILEAIAWALSLDPEDLIMRRPGDEIWSIMDNLKRMDAADRQQVARIVQTFRRVS